MPSALYAAECSISGTTVFRNFVRRPPARPARLACTARGSRRRTGRGRCRRAPASSWSTSDPSRAAAAPTSSFLHDFAVDQTLEVDERIEPGHVRILGARGPVGIERAGRRVPARLRLARGGGVHRLDVGLPPAVLRSAQLVGERLGRAGIDAAAAQDLLILGGSRGRGGEIGELRTVLGCLRGRTLSADQRDLVGQLAARDPVVEREQLALLGQRLREVRVCAEPNVAL